MDAHRETLEYYERFAESYARRSMHRLDRDALLEFGRRVAGSSKARALDSPLRVLDAGCGAGRDLKWFGLAGFEVEGFDASPALIARARESWPAARVWQSDFLFLQLERSRYRGVWANRSLLHLPAPGVQRALQSFFSALEPEGWLFVSMEEGEGSRTDRTDALSSRSAASSVSSELSANSQSPGSDESTPARHIFQYPRQEFLSLLRQNGFRIELEGQELSRPGSMAFLARRI